MKKLALVLVASTLAAGGMSYAAAKPSDDDKYEITEVGEPKSCIIRSQIRQTDVIDDETIDFVMRNGDIYRNKLPYRCNGLGFEEAFSYRTSVNRLCNVDIIRVLDQTAGRIQTRAACGLGKFQQIEKIRKDDKDG